MTTTAKPHDTPGRRPARIGGNATLAIGCVVFAASMVGMAYAAVPLYQLFCQVTGYGGTTQAASAAPAQIIDRGFSIRFDANVAARLPWRFRPAQTAVAVKGGEVATATYVITNTSDRPTTAIASFNVTPLAAGAYFNKIACFCFTEQTLGPGESREVPVTFFVDPKIDADGDLDTIETITLSYTFFADEAPEPAPVKKVSRADY